MSRHDVLPVCTWATDTAFLVSCSPNMVRYLQRRNEPNIKTKKKGVSCPLGGLWSKKAFHHLKLWAPSETPRTASCRRCTDTPSGCCYPPSTPISSLHPEDTKQSHWESTLHWSIPFMLYWKASLPWCPQFDTWGQRATGGDWAACWGRTGSQPPRPTARWWPRSGEGRTATGEGRPSCWGGKKNTQFLRFKNGIQTVYVPKQSTSKLQFIWDNNPSFRWPSLAPCILLGLISKVLLLIYKPPNCFGLAYILNSLLLSNPPSQSQIFIGRLFQSKLSHKFRKIIF